jgi:predicted transcriptional regulator
MDTVPRPNNGDPETASDAQHPHALEADMIAEAEADLEAGLFIDEGDVDAWIDSLGIDHELPLPKPHR